MDSSKDSSKFKFFQQNFIFNLIFSKGHLVSQCMNLTWNVGTHIMSEEMLKVTYHIHRHYILEKIQERYWEVMEN